MDAGFVDFESSMVDSCSPLKSRVAIGQPNIGARLMPTSHRGYPGFIYACGPWAVLKFIRTRTLIHDQGRKTLGIGGTYRKTLSSLSEISSVSVWSVILDCPRLRHVHHFGIVVCSGLFYGRQIWPPGCNCKSGHGPLCTLGGD
jgi:hypothetical protein